MHQPPPATRLIPPHAAPVIRAFGDEMILHLGSSETGGRYTMFTLVTPPGGGPPPHAHRDEDEWFLVLEGRAEFLANGEWTGASPGTAVFAPRGSVHGFRNTGDTPLRMLVQTAPAGFEIFFARCAEVFTRPGPPDMPLLAQIAGEHGIRFVEA